MKIYKIQSNCGEFQKPKGHLDTQMYPECEGTKADRDIVKKTREKREKDKKKKKKTASVNNPHIRNECPFCNSVTVCKCPDWVHAASGVEKTNDFCDKCKEALIVTAKKKKKKGEDYKYNPWAVCNTKVDKKKDPEKFERCVKKVKKKQTKACSICAK